MSYENPLKRCIIPLAGANNYKPDLDDDSDGVLTGVEAASLNLQGTELVILSACSTGEGNPIKGQGTMSLKRAFRIAGAKTVLSSHWQVSDAATAELMVRFFKEKESGKGKWRLSGMHNFT